MRNLLLLPFLFFGALLSAQCNIDVTITRTECTADGSGYFLFFDVEGAGGSAWTSPELGVSGSYDTDEIFQAGPLALGLDSITFRDTADLSCVLVIDPPTVDCGQIDLCESFSPTITTDFQDSAPCSDNGILTVFLSEGNSDSLYITVVNFASVEIVVREDINGNFANYDALPDGIYQVTVANELGCMVTQDIEIARGSGCAFIVGVSFKDNNGDGLRNQGDTELPTTVELLLEDQVVQTRAGNNGGYFFSNLAYGDYTVRFVAPSGHEATIRDADGNESSNIDPVTLTSDVLSLSADNQVDTINAGWVPTAECQNFVAGLFQEVSNTCDPNAQALIGADITEGSYPVTVYVSMQEASNVTDSIVVDSGYAEIPGVPLGAFVFVTAVDANGCTSSASFATIDTSDGFEVNIETFGNICDTVGVSLRAEIEGANVEDLIFEWNTGATTQVIEDIFVSDIYSVLATNTVTGCQVEASFELVNSGGITIATIFFPEPFVISCDEDSVLVVVPELDADFTYEWFGPLNQRFVGSSFMAVMPGLYTVVATNVETGCELSGRATVRSESLSGQFIEVFTFGNDSICGQGSCFGLETTLSPNEVGTWFNARWQGPNDEYVAQLNENPLNFFCSTFPGLYELTITTDCDTIRESFVLEYPLACSSISGNLWLDQSANCALDADDTGVPNYVITLTNEANGDTYYEMTNATGEWTSELPVGTYVVEPTLALASPYGTCDPAPVVTLGNDPVTGVNVFLPVEVSCAQLTTSVSLPFLRRCFSSSAWVQYENVGAVTAEDAVLTVTLDDYFDDVTTVPAFSARDGQTFTFDLGDLAAFEGGTVRFNFVISCESALGQSHCVEASITPDEPCNTNAAWNGALVSIEPGGCQGDSLVFLVRNIGDNQMTVPLTYVIVEDGIMLTPVPLINGNLTPGEEMPIFVEATGGAFHVITNQEPNAPGDEEPSAFIEGCNLDGNFSTGFANILGLGNGLSSSATVCRENVGSYDPNDKRGFPLGFGNDQIASGTRLDYNVRFQNTGTDTAFTVVISDTIAETLDLATLKFGAASHDYTVALDTHRVLTFTFENILLPDSTTNLAGSQGVVTFSIDHTENLPFGTELLNEAAIYFDFNEPVITNVSRHVISKEGLPVGVRAVLAQQIPVSVFPNPTDGVINVNVPRADVTGRDLLQVTDLYGRTLARTTYDQAVDGWNLNHLAAGYYLLVVTDENGRAKGRTGFVVSGK